MKLLNTLSRAFLTLPYAIKARALILDRVVMMNLCAASNVIQLWDELHPYKPPTKIIDVGAN